jgi:uncharacterized membrane protein
MTGWLEFVAAFTLFMASHAIPARPAIRARLSRAIGERGYLVAYVVTSLAALAWVIVAAGRAPYVGLWNPAPWMLWVPTLAMPVVCLLIAFAVAAPNPLSFGGARPDRFDPDRPGIAGVTRHPLLWALALWSGAHLVPNGDLAHAALFGAFAVFSLAGMAAIDRRIRRRLGAAEWHRLAARTSLVPFAALITGRWRPASRPDGQRLGLGVALWLTLLTLHPPVIGVSALPLAPAWWPDPLQLARAVHVVAVVHWIGGVAMVTTILLPLARASREARFETFERFERRFAPQARISVAAAGFSGVWMTEALGAWGRFLDPAFWWMHAMLALWLVFAAVLYIAEPLWLDAWARARAAADEAATLRLIARAHRVLLTLSLAVTGAAVLGAHGAI